MFEKSEEKRLKQAERQRKGQLGMLGIKATSFNLKVKDDVVREFMNKDSGGSMKGAVASVQTEGEIRERFTATRILVLGGVCASLQEED